MTFHRVALVNRGDAALRFLRAAREADPVAGAPLQVVAVHTDPDRHAPFVRLADDAVSLGPALRNHEGGRRLAYLDHDLLLDAIRSSGCDAVWPGWGFVAEDADFVERLEAEGIVFIGPSSRAMRTLGDKVSCKRLAESSGVPLAPWSELDLHAPRDQWLDAGESVGFPLMVKASNGGGGRGIRRVRAAGELADAIVAVEREARAAFGPGAVFLERCIEHARHVEVQFLVDAEGRASSFGVRDCTVQRRHQKVLEETPSPVLSPVEEQRLCEATTTLALAADYRGVGTAEFLYQSSERMVSFCEVNARLQVEHTVTELVWGIDLVRAQIDVALGRPTDTSPGPRGWAIEARLVAEDAERGFAPTPGRVLVHRPPAGPNIRVDAGVRAGSDIPPEFDSMIAKVLAWGPTRARALATLRRALEEYEVVIEDGATNRGVLLDLLRTPEVVDATATTGWLDEEIAAGSFEQPGGSYEAVLLAAVQLARADRRARARRFLAAAATGVPRPDAEATHPVELELSLRGVTHRLRVSKGTGSRWFVSRDGVVVALDVEHVGDTAVIARIDGQQVRALVHRGRNGVAVDVGGGVHRVMVAGAGTVRAPGPALLVDLSVAVGDSVDAGQRVGTLEAMKTEAPLVAEVSGTVSRLLVEPGTQVSAGQAIVEVDVRAGDHGSRPSVDRNVTADHRDEPLWPASTPVDHCLTTIGVCRALLLGREVAPAAVESARRTLDVLAASSADDREWAPLAESLRIFADIEALFERNLLLLDDHSAAVSASEAFHDVCRHHHRGEEGVLVELRPLLSRALAHADVSTLEPTDAFRDALWRLAATRSRTAARDRLMTSVIRAVASLSRRGIQIDDARLSHDLADVERASIGSLPGVADAAATARAELDSRPRVTALSASDVQPAELYSLERYGEFDAEIVSSVRGPAGRAAVVRLRSREDLLDERTILAVESDDTPTDLAGVTAADLSSFTELFEQGVRLLRGERGRTRDWWASMHVVLHRTERATTRNVMEVAQMHEAVTRGLGLQELTIRVGQVDATTEFLVRRRGHARLELEEQHGVEPTVGPRSELDRRALRARRSGLVDPWELIGMLTGSIHHADLPHPSLVAGSFTEYDSGLDGIGPVDRPPAQHSCGVVVGVVANPLPGRNEFGERVWIAGDPLRAMGSLGRAECERIIGMIDCAEERGIPVEWVALSSGARIAMDSGTENLDWTAAVLRRIVSFTSGGGEINVIVAGVNVGAQSYWNAEATMLMHTRGILVMIPQSTMVLTGNKALEMSGSVGAEDEVGIGGFDRVMGPNGQAQYRAHDIAGAYAILLDHYARTHSSAGARPPVLTSTDPVDRDVTIDSCKGDDGFATIGEIFDVSTNPGRKRPFAIRSLMEAVVDTDSVVSERWRNMAEASTAVVWGTRMGGHAITMIGIESRPTARTGAVPVDGPAEFSGGTLYPLSSKKVARAIRSASGNHPVVVLANLSGFDGSPESLRRLQLEYGAEIARAVVEFDGPIVFVVIGRYHGGAYVVFSKQLNPRLTALAVEGSYASVIGGAPAAAVVLTREVRSRVESDPDVARARVALDQADGDDGDLRLRCVEELDSARQAATTRARAQVAAEFDAVHTVERAVTVGSLDAIISARRIRPEIIAVLAAEART